MQTSALRKRMPVTALTDPNIIVPAIGAAFRKLSPRVLIKNPVMFVVEIVAAMATALFVRDLMSGGENLAFTFRSFSGSGSPSSLPISPKPSPKAAARLRPPLCGRRGRRRLQN
jgi:hypothetical protein